MDKAVARAKIAADQATKIAREIDAEFASEPRYQQARSTMVQARERGAELLEEARQTEQGARIGAKARSAAEVIGKLPVFTAVADAARARHAVDELHALVVEAPTDPLRAVWLAEALDRVNEDLHRYRAVRSVTSLTYAATRQLVSTTVALGHDSSDPTRTKLLKSAYSRSRRTLIDCPEDSAALHTLARVYLAQGDPRTATRMAKLALMLDEKNGLVWITLARCYSAAGLAASARVAATRGADHGASYAYEILAADVLTGPDRAPSNEACAEFERLRSLVTPDGRAAYLGAAVDPRTALSRLKDQQAARTLEAYDWIKGEL